MKNNNLVFYLIALALGLSVIFVALWLKLVFIVILLLIRFRLKEAETRNQFTGFFAAGIIAGFLVKLIFF